MKTSPGVSCKGDFLIEAYTKKYYTEFNILGGKICLIQSRELIVSLDYLCATICGEDIFNILNMHGYLDTLTIGMEQR